MTPVDVGLVGDPGLTADATVKWLDEAEIPGSGYRNDELAQKIHAFHAVPHRLKRTPAEGTVDLFEPMQALNGAFPKDRVVVGDTGRFLIGAWAETEVKNPRDYVDTIGFASIGLGLGAAIGATVAADGRSTLFIAGDGGFMLGGVSELATIAREQLDVTLVVCNGSSYGAEYIQYAGRSVDPATSMHRWLEFAPIAAAFGFGSPTVRSSADLQAAMTAWEKCDRKQPFFIDAKLGAAVLPHPWARRSSPAWPSASQARQRCGAGSGSSALGVAPLHALGRDTEHHLLTQGLNSSDGTSPKGHDA